MRLEGLNHVPLGLACCQNGKAAEGRRTSGARADEATIARYLRSTSDQCSGQVLPLMAAGVQLWMGAQGVMKSLGLNRPACLPVRTALAPRTLGNPGTCSVAKPQGTTTEGQQLDVPLASQSSAVF